MAVPKKKNRLTIGALARTAGIGVETVRYYQRRGLLGKPEKPLGRIRSYSEDDLVDLWVIRHGKELGFTLNEIGHLRAVVKERNCEALHLLAEHKLSALKDEIRVLQHAYRALKRLTDGCTGDCQGECSAIERFAVNGFHLPRHR